MGVPFFIVMALILIGYLIVMQFVEQREMKKQIDKNEAKIDLIVKHLGYVDQDIKGMYEFANSIIKEKEES
jgi:uncharacterized protein YneF (UPF0154 family)